MLPRSTARKKAEGSKASPPIHMSALRSGESSDERRALRYIKLRAQIPIAMGVA
jgi:hypothetical protein